MASDDQQSNSEFAEIARLKERVHELERRLAELLRSTPIETPLRQSCGEMRRAEERLEMVLSSAALAWWDQNFVTGVVERSASWAEMLGYSADDIGVALSDWKELIHPDDLPRVEQAAAHHEANRTPIFEVEHRMRARDGSWRWILNWGRIVERDEAGRPIRALGAHLDITRRKEAELDRERLIHRLRKALAEIKTLRGIIPICASCKKVRDDRGDWRQIETYFCDHADAEFSHGICPECLSTLYPELTGIDEEE